MADKEQEASAVLETICVAAKWPKSQTSAQLAEYIVSRLRDADMGWDVRYREAQHYNMLLAYVKGLVSAEDATKAIGDALSPPWPETLEQKISRLASEAHARLIMQRKHSPDLSELEVPMLPTTPAEAE